MRARRTPKNTWSARGTAIGAALLLFCRPPVLADGLDRAREILNGREVIPGVVALTGFDLKPRQTVFDVPELPDAYATLAGERVIVSGTAQYHLEFRSVADLAKGGPYRRIWNEFFSWDGAPLAPDRFFAHSWDMKPALWARTTEEGPRLWDAALDRGQKPLVIWYGGRMSPSGGRAYARWPDDNYNRNIFAYQESGPGRWISTRDPVIPVAAPLRPGNYLGHRYGHQIVMAPDSSGKPRATVFYEEVTRVRSDGTAEVTALFMDRMVSPFKAEGRPIQLLTPVNPRTGRYYPSTVREDGAALIEGPLYFRFSLGGEEWEAIGFSAGSFYGRYPACFAYRKVADGRKGKPYVPDLTDDGNDLHDAGAELGAALDMTGGPGRPSVIVDSSGHAVRGPGGALQLLVHGYRNDILGPEASRYRLDQRFRLTLHALLAVEQRPGGRLRFRIHVPRGRKPAWVLR